MKPARFVVTSTDKTFVAPTLSIVSAFPISALGVLEGGAVCSGLTHRRWAVVESESKVGQRRAHSQPQSAFALVPVVDPARVLFCDTCRHPQQHRAPKLSSIRRPQRSSTLTRNSSALHAKQTPVKIIVQGRKRACRSTNYETHGNKQYHHDTGVWFLLCVADDI